MPLIPILVAIFGGLYAVFKYWDEIMNWLDRCLPEAKRAIDEALKNIAHAADIFAKHVKNAMAEIKYSVFFKENNKWIEGFVTREVPEEEVPPHIRAKIARQEAAITDDLKPMLKSREAVLALEN